MLRLANTGRENREEEPDDLVREDVAGAVSVLVERSKAVNSS